MRIVFRADAGKELGSGHIMRLLPLMQEFSSRGYSCLLVGKVDELPWLSARLEENHVLQIQNWDEFSPESVREDILIIDSYNIPIHDYFVSLPWGFIASIVDSSTPDYRCNLLIHPGFQDDIYKKRGLDLLSGIEFLLLRQVGGLDSARLDTTPSNVVLCGGGSDPSRFVKEVMKTIVEIDVNYNFHVFTNDNIDPGNRSNIIFHPIGKGLDRYMNSSALAIVPASTLAFEFLAYGVPIAIGACVENQFENYKKIQEHGLGVGIGSFSKEFGWDMNPSKIIEFLDSSISDLHNRNSRSGQKVDFQGPRRIADQLLARFQGVNGGRNDG
jgi:spore coat polysaccharide biosynthesis predicted glycosyltransferase SpsG